jgi:RNA polymerase sigma-70 factor (ECF subfamily)
MYRVALNTAISFTRKPSLIIHARELPDIISDDPYLSDLSEDTKLLHKAIAMLGRVDKALIILWLEDRSYEEIAGTLGISVKNVSVKLVRIKARLAEIMKRMQ